MTPDEMKHFREVRDNAMRMVALVEVERRRVEDHNNMLKAENERLAAENARLQGMLEEAWDCIKFGAACAGCGSWCRHGKLCKLMGFLRDIGIEVDPDVGRYGY